MPKSDRNPPPRPTLASVARQNAALRRRLSALRHEHAELLAAARTAVAAHFDGDAEPLSVLVDALDELGALPEYMPQLTDLALGLLGAGDAPVSGRRVA
ncbi:hypothetical protein [Streptomyces triculaminicus]|uniref:hypothetical protein n=1 Tax=Streptomyces triculaminicus TaxID=2816232 RepID=UPI00379A36B2